MQGGGEGRIKKGRPQRERPKGKEAVGAFVFNRKAGGNPAV
jgi:hypothetical protein